jgi:hypothetical protein
VFCRPCLDWSERRCLLHRCVERGWIARQRDSRAVTITRAGAEQMREIFGVTLS